MANFRLKLDVQLAHDAPPQPLAAFQGAMLPARLPTAPEPERLTLACTLRAEVAEIVRMLDAVAPWVRMPDNQVVGSLENLDDARQLIEEIVFSRQSLLLIAAQPGPDDLYNYYR